MKKISSIIKRSLKEDIGKGDITTNILISSKLKGKAIIVAKEKGIIAGLRVVSDVFKKVNSRLQFRGFKEEGAVFKKNEVVAEVSGILKSILIAERTALNFLSRLSGIATFTDKFKKEVADYKVKIMDTRKTMPCLRYLEKYAVSVGGGFNHRFALDEMILIKDNHIKISSYQFPVSNLKKIINKVRKKTGGKKKIEVEVTNLEEFKQSLKEKPDIIMLDNMDIEEIKKAVALRREFCKSANLVPELEVSGGVNLMNVQKIAQTGVERISIGALTNAGRWLDFSLEVVELVSET